MGKISNTDYHPKLKDINFNFEIETNKLKDKLNNIDYVSVDNYNEQITRFVFKYDDINDKENSIYNFKILKNDDEEYRKCNILLVGGGGGGGYNIGGGGGGGRVVYLDNVLLKTDKEYKINVGSGGEGGNKDYYSGDSGYSSTIGNYIALGGGGGGSYTSSDLKYNNNSDLIIKEINLANSNSRGLDGGSGGGNCFLSFNSDTNIEFISGRNKDTDYNKYITEENNEFKSYGNDGGISKINRTKENNEKKFFKNEHRAAGGGGAGGKGSDTFFNEDNIGNGGDGISIEKINNEYCAIDLPDKNNINYCKNKNKNDESELQYIQRDRSINLEENEYLYWGAGGGGGSLNTNPGYGGKGGGGSGGYHELATDTLNWVDTYKEEHENDKDRYCIILNDSDDNNFSYANFSTEPNNINDKTLSKGGNGIKHTGSGGGGGGWNSNGGNGGSGIVIILVHNEDYKIKKNYQSIIETELKLLQLNNKFKKNKYILGTNLASLYHYYIKEHTYFLQYIEKIYENEILNKKDDILHNYDFDIYNSKFNLYIKLIYDLKIETEQFLFYTNGEEKCNPNTELNNQKETLAIITNLIEDVMYYFNDKYNTLDKLQKYETIEIKYNKDRIKKNDINNKKIIFYTDKESNNYSFELNEIKNIDEDEDENNNNLTKKMIIKKYLKIIIFVKKYNFDKNLLALYIFFINIKLLQDLYYKSESFLKIKDCDNIHTNENKIKELDDLVDNFENNIQELKNLYGYKYIDYYIDNVIFKNVNLNNNNYPYVNFEIEDKDKIIIESDDIINNFIVEIDDNDLNSRYEIKKCEILDNKIKITIIVNKKKEYNHIDNKKSKLYNIRLSHKDETFIKNNYNNDINKLKEYHEKIENIKKNLQKISNNYNTYENSYNKILNKSYIYYTILTIASILIIIIYLTNGTNSVKLSLLSIISIICIILVIYNNTTKIHLDIIDNFTNFEKSYKILHEFKFTTENFEYDSNGNFIISIDYEDDNKLKRKLRIEKIDDDTDDKNLKQKIIKNHSIKIKKDGDNDDDNYYEFNIVEINFESECFNNYKHKTYKCISQIIIEKTDKLTELLNTDIILQLIKYKNETSLEKLYDNNNYKIDKNLKENFTKFLKENSSDNDQEKEKLVKLEKMKYIILIRDNVLSYINNKFIEINKIISNIELQKSNEIYNNVSKTLEKEKKTFNQYIKEYEYNKNINNNNNKIYKHKLISQISLNNFILNIYLILIIALLLYSLFPNYFNIIVVLLIFSISLNAIFYTIKQREYTRTDSYKKYWFKPTEKNNIIVNNNYI